MVTRAIFFWDRRRVLCRHNLDRC